MRGGAGSSTGSMPASRTYASHATRIVAMRAMAGRRSRIGLGQEVVREQRAVVRRRGQGLAVRVDEEALVVEERRVARPLLERLRPGLAVRVDEELLVG